MKDVLDEMLKLLSDEDKQVFETLSTRLATVKGDIRLLSDEDREVIKRMETKYGDKINNTHSQRTKTFEGEDLLSLPFAQQVRQILARDLGEQFPEEEVAVAYVFDNRWLPVDCSENELAESLFDRFKGDIETLNQWRNEMVNVDSDKKMAVGLAWFMVIFQLNQRLNG